jgi:hypothetical protein
MYRLVTVTEASSGPRRTSLLRYGCRAASSRIVCRCLRLPHDMVKIVSIMGYTRSGSTLLDCMLGELDGVFSTGELHYLWERGLEQGRRCGCGRPVTSCPVWSSILRAAFGADAPRPKDVERWLDRAVRTRHTWSLLRGNAGAFGDAAALRAARETMNRLYPAIAETTGARVVVDSSKRPSDAALVRLLEDVDAYVIHLVRDPRAIVFSWRRSKRELDADEDVDMPRQPVLKSASEWVEVNLAADAVRRAMGRRRAMLLRYEDLLRDPRRTISSIASFVGEPMTDGAFVDDRTIDLGENHTVAGNPSRFTRGHTPLRIDAEWRHRIASGDRIATTVVTAPFLRRYGYAIGDARDHAERAAS